MPQPCRLIPAPWPPLRSPGRSFRVGTWPGTLGALRLRARPGSGTVPGLGLRWPPPPPPRGPGRAPGRRGLAQWQQRPGGRRAPGGFLQAAPGRAERYSHGPRDTGARALGGPRPRLRAPCAAVGRPCPCSRVAAIAAAAAGYASPAAARSDSAHRRPPSLSFCKNTVYSTRRTHSRAHTHTQSHTDTRARTQTHTPHTHLYTRTHTRAHARAQPGPPARTRTGARERARRAHPASQVPQPGMASGDLYEVRRSRGAGGAREPGLAELVRA